MNSFSIDKQRDKVNAEWMSRPVGDRQPLVLVLISMQQSLTFAYRLKRKLLSGPIFGGAYTAYKVFIDYAKELAQSSLNDKQNNQTNDGN